MSHTPEPWPEPKWIPNIHSPWRIYATASFDNLEDAQRAVTCVNACAGMADPEAEMREKIRELESIIFARRTKRGIPWNQCPPASPNTP